MQVKNAGNYKEREAKKTFFIDAPFLPPSILWEGIELGKVNYKIKNIDRLKKVIWDFNLAEFQNDFLFLSFKHLLTMQSWKRFDESINWISGSGDELEDALKFVLEYSPKEIKIDFNSTLVN